MNILRKIKNTNHPETFETMKKETNGQSKSAIFKKVTGEVPSGLLCKLCDYEIREDSAMCIVMISKDDGSAVKK